MHKINPNIHLMCELHVTVKLFTTTCSLSENFMFLQFAYYLYQFTTICKYEWLVIKGKMKLEILKEFGLNLISNSVCAIAWSILSSQKYEHEIWQKKKWRKIIQTLRFLKPAWRYTYVRKNRRNKHFFINDLIKLCFFDMFRTTKYHHQEICVSSFTVFYDASI